MKQRKSSHIDRARAAASHSRKLASGGTRDPFVVAANQLESRAASNRRQWWLLAAMLTVILGIGLVAGVGWLRVAANPSPLAIQEAVRLAKRGRFVEAEPVLRRALQVDPANVELLKTLTMGLFDAKRLSEADAVLTQWCQVQPPDAQPLRLRMDLRHNTASQFKPGTAQDRLKEMALADGLQVLEMAPEDVTTAKKVVWLCLAAGRFDQAEQICSIQLKRLPDDSELLFLMARVYHSQGANRPAQEALGKLLIIRPDDSAALLLLAVLHYEANESEQAIPLLRRVIAESGGSHKEARYHLSLALARAGHAEEAQRLMAEVQLENFERETAREGQPDGLPVRLRRAELLFACGRDAQAVAELQAILNAEPDNAAALRLLGNADAGREDSSKANLPQVNRDSEPTQ